MRIIRGVVQTQRRIRISAETVEARYQEREMEMPRPNEVIATFAPRENPRRHFLAANTAELLLLTAEIEIDLLLISSNSGFLEVH